MFCSRELKGEGKVRTPFRFPRMSSHLKGTFLGGQAAPGESPHSTRPPWQTLPAPEARAAALVRMLGLEFNITIKGKSCASLLNYYWSFSLQGRWEYGREEGAASGFTHFPPILPAQVSTGWFELLECVVPCCPVNQHLCS